MGRGPKDSTLFPANFERRPASLAPAWTSRRRTGSSVRTNAWITASAGKGAPQPLLDAGGTALLLRSRVILFEASRPGLAFPLARTAAKKIDLRWEEPSCRLIVKAARATRGTAMKSLAREIDGTFALPVDLVPDGLEIDVDFPQFHPVDDDGEACVLRVVPS